MNSSTKALSRSPNGRKHDTTTKSTGVSPGTLSKIVAPIPLGRQEHLRPVTHTMLTDMSPADMGTMLHGLDQARAQYESLSGACATLAGLVCIEAKARLKHGEYLPWLKTHLKKHRDTAADYVNVAKVFLKCRPMTTFDQLTLALMDGAQSVSVVTLDRTHPIVDAVCKWTNGRTFYQLKQEESIDGRATNKGGFKPNLTWLRGWLRENFAEHEDLEKWMTAQFFELPKEVQIRYKAEGQRYEKRLSKEARLEMETAEEARTFNASMATTVNGWLDAGLFQRATEEQTQAQETALDDLLKAVRKHRAASRKGGNGK